MQVSRKTALKIVKMLLDLNTVAAVKMYDHSIIRSEFDFASMR